MGVAQRAETEPSTPIVRCFVPLVFALITDTTTVKLNRSRTHVSLALILQERQVGAVDGGFIAVTSGGKGVKRILRWLKLLVVRNDLFYFLSYIGNNMTFY